jgi:hypothetical protein
MKQKLQISTLILFAGFVGTFLFSQLFITNAKIDSNSNDSKQMENQLPEIAGLKHDKIGVGQRMTFGLEVIDEEGDFVKIELAEKPKSAKFNQNTLTVDWTPTVSDGENGKFVVKVTEIPRDKSRQNRTVTKEYNIKIVKKQVKLKELPITSVEVDSFVSIIDPERLKAANKKWDIVSFFQRAGEIEADKQIKPGSDIQPSNGRQLFRDALKELAIMHKNPEIDPDSKQFNKVWNAENWKLIAVRPRINKKVFELRLVYFNVAAAEQVYLMPRMRIIRGDDASRPDDLRQKNNLTFAKKFHETFFDGENMKPFVANDKAKYGEALEKFITWVLTYDDPTDPMMKANFAALPHNSRLGGGNVYDEKGNYLYGDGWALGVMQLRPVERNGKKVLAVVSPPIAGFVASIKPSEGGMKWNSVAAPITDPKNSAYKKGWEAVYDEDNHSVFIPEEMPDGKIGKSNIDTTINAYDYKFKYMTAETKLDDPRRRLFEEKGMTCMQCHIRNFDEGDYLTGVQKPKETPENVSTRKIPRVFFIITPTLHNGRNEYIHREEQEQVGNLKGVFRDYLGINVKMSSPLAIDWVHNTKKGRS